MHRTKVFLDPFSKMSYSSFYIKGLYDVFGKKNVHFSDNYFKDLKRQKGILSFDHYMALVVVDSDNRKTKMIIDFHDNTHVQEDAYQWADKYAKININSELTGEKFREKLVSIPPGFGVKIYNFWQTAYISFFNLVRSGFSPSVSLKDYFVDYYRSYKRSKLGEYLKKDTNDEAANADDYVFMIGSLWSHKNCIDGTNLQRKAFFELCKASNCHVEGGFFASTTHPQYEEFKDIVFSKRYSFQEYLKKSKLSAFVFNTPSVLNCHGWKLGEFLAMGKAIISMPISNELPADLKHGENIHFVSNEGEMKEAINLLSTDHSYRRKLEAGARRYYLKYVAPGAVVKNVLRNVLIEPAYSDVADYGLLLD